MSTKSSSKFMLAAVNACLIIAFIIIANHLVPFSIDNDNIYLKTVLSGEMTGTPDMHAYYIGSITGIIISSLYKLTGNGIPWFGIVLCLYMGSVIWYVLFGITKNCKRWFTALTVATVSMLFVSSVFYRYFAETQFTIVGGILGAGAVFALCMTDIKKTIGDNIFNLLFLGIFSLLSYSVRSSAFYMVIPFLGMVLVGKFFDFIFKRNEKRYFSVLFACAVIIVATFALNFAANKIAYSADDWKSYDRYNEAHADMVDYEGFPDYDTYRDVYESFGIKKSSYVALTEHYNLILDKNINEESFTALDEINKNIRKETNKDVVAKIKEVTVSIINRNLKDYTDRPINVFVFFIYLSVVILSLLSKKFLALRDLAFIIVARMFDWFYLVYFGRYPFRVTQIIYIAELFALIAVIMKYKLWERAFPKIISKLKLSPVFILSLLMVVFISIRFGLPVMNNVKNQVNGFDKLSVCFVELEDYLESHPDNFYFIDMSNLHYRERTLGFGKSPYENYLYMGSWITNSPWYNDKLEAHGIVDPSISLLERDDLFIIYQISEGYDRTFLDDYFDEHFPGSTVEKVDELITSNGFVYEILKPRYN
ncbi:MAG: hypothetical protein K5669_10570 [Lachnospiraceae bacterium]|nr:hypothetical protein [Lachnospiraceae bacterium]